MAIPVFPTLSKKPASIIPIPENSGLATDMSDGYVVSRARFTRSRLTFSVTYTALPYSDLEKIQDFYRETIYGEAMVFNWINSDPNSKYYNQTFIVRMIELGEPSFTHPFWWNVNFKVVQL
jgi:hypothetical protein